MGAGCCKEDTGPIDGDGNPCLISINDIHLHHPFSLYSGSNAFPFASIRRQGSLWQGPNSAEKGLQEHVRAKVH